MNWSRCRRVIVLGVVIVGSGLMGCGSATPETGSAGIPGHRGPATQSTKKQPVRPKLPPGAKRGTK